MVFDTCVGDRVLTCGVSGKLRDSDMVMYNRQTESRWQQAVGQGIVGEMTGVELTVLPTWMESWEEHATRRPDGLVMALPLLPRRYGTNPYLGYDTSTRPFLYNGDMAPHDIPPLMRVIRVGDRVGSLDRVRDAGGADVAHGVMFTLAFHAFWPDGTWMLDS